MDLPLDTYDMMVKVTKCCFKKGDAQLFKVFINPVTPA